MRIISGKFKGRRFHPPADKWPTRPTTDFAKEGLFNVLNNLLDFEAVHVLDLFGGTGSHSYEFISRGCTDVTYVDKFPACAAFVQKTAIELGIENHLRIVRGDVFKFIETCARQFDYIFAGPPYPLPTIDTIPDLIFQYNLLTDDGLFVLEHDPSHSYKNHPHFWQERHYGKTIFSFFVKKLLE
ncbi:MAG TPA: RsmD family RNA methyltransferase [Saprospiraceae bacterium]|nr:RsmD family RNA methyltransferase [Saprospiraceae bacterium]HMP23959.1 RsmD family RNA methyltransferase [Saprospiraceae bacterium]